MSCRGAPRNVPDIRPVTQRQKRLGRSAMAGWADILLSVSAGPAHLERANRKFQGPSMSFHGGSKQLRTGLA